MRSDIKTGVNFSELQDRNYSSAGETLRSEWSFWRKTAPKYKFGRTELLPVVSNEEAIGRYVGKYIGKHMNARNSDDKGARLVRYSRGSRMASTRYQFVSEGSAHWRAKLKQFAYFIAEKHDVPPTMESLRSVLGPRWAHNHRDYILSMPG